MNFLEWLSINSNWKSFILRKGISSLEELRSIAPEYHYYMNQISFLLNQKKSLEEIGKDLNLGKEKIHFYLNILFKENSIDMNNQKWFDPIEREKTELILPQMPEFEVINLPGFFLKDSRLNKNNSVIKMLLGGVLFILLMSILNNIDFLQSWKALEKKVSSTSLEFKIPKTNMLKHNLKGKGLKVNKKGTLTLKSKRSIYEESSKNGMRGIHPSSRSYRLILNSINLTESKALMDRLINKYKAKKVDRVKPGTQIPGGVYYNLYINEKKAKQFLEELKTKEEGSIYSGRSQKNIPRGMSRVFVWIKGV